MVESKGSYKIPVMVILLCICCVLTYYFHTILETGRVFTHFFYVPIILAAMWWRRKGLVVAIFLSALLIFSHIFVRSYVITANDYLRSLGFIIIALVIATLSERIAKAQERSDHLTAILRGIQNVNQLIAREKDRDRLIRKACESLIETMGYHSAWITLVDENGRFLTAAEAGIGAFFSPVLEIMKRGEFTKCVRDALDQPGIVMIEDVAAACADCPLASTYLGRAGLTVRMEHGGRVYGVLSTLTPAEMAADAYEQLLFNEVAGDLAFALHDMELELARKRAEGALRRFSEELESKVEERTKELANERDYTLHLIESSPDFQMILDKNGRIMDVNKAFLCVVGKSLEELIGSSIYNCLPKEETEKAISEIFERGKVRNIELTVDIPGKGTLISNFSGTIFTTPEGKKEIYVTGRDITEQRRVEDVLLESEEKFRTFMETASDLMVFTDEDGNITYANEAMVGTLGYSKEELIGMHITQLLSKQALERDFKPENLKKLIAEGKLSLETIYATKDGKEIYGELKVVAVYDIDGEYTGGKAVFYDLTERKRAEDIIKKSLKEKEILIMEIHHRVKNNLQIILSLIDMQARATEDKDVKDALSEARDRIMAMSLIHTQLYEGSDLSEIDMNEFVDRLLGQLLSYQSGDTRITRVILVNDYPFPISVAVPVGLIINELLSNALKHAFGGRGEGTIKVSLTTSEDGRANLTVSDDGVGMPPGFDIDESKTLGLRLVKILTEDQLQGTLEVTSDGGATFKMEFDIKDSGSDRLT